MAAASRTQRNTLVQALHALPDSLPSPAVTESDRARSLARSGRPEQLARAYAGYYLAGWRVFRAHRLKDAEAETGAVRAALEAGVEAIRLGIAAARG